MENKTSNKKQREIHLTKSKHLDLAIVIFVVAVTIVSVFIILNIFGVFTRVSGYFALKATVENGVSYDNEVNCALYFYGTAYTTNRQKTDATSLYTATLKKAYLHIDAETTHVESSSIADINVNVGNAVTVDEEVYKIVKDAYSKTNIEENNYSIFAAPLYDEWFKLCSFAADGDPDQDPANNAEEKAYIEEFVAILNDDSNFSLEFLEGNQIKLSISNTYKAFRDKYSVESPIVSLNVLENVYKMNEVKKAFEENGLTNGYLSSTEGYGITLSNLESLSHNVYNIGVKSGAIGYIAFDGNHVFKKNQMFNYEGVDSYYYYSFEDSSHVKHYRNQNLNLKTGYPNEYYLSAMLFKQSDDLFGIAMDNQKLLLIDSSEKEAEFLNNYGSYEICLNKPESPNSYFLTKNLKNKIYIFNSEVYTINIINKEE